MSKDSSLNGLQTSYYDNGHKKLETNYKDGDLEGKSTFWYENGHIEAEMNYINNKKEGKWTEWHENGQKKLESNYKDDKQDGEMTNWDVDGDVIGYREYKAGELIWSYSQNTNKNFNIGALEGKNFVIPDKDIYEVMKVFPKELLHTPFMNLWLAWYHFNENLDADPEHEHLKNHIDAFQLLNIQFERMRKIIPIEHWNEISKEYYPNKDNEWWLDEGKLISACKFCFSKHPPSYEGFIQDEDGFRLAYELDHEFLGKWSLNPNDKFWKTEESLNRYYRYFFWRDKTGEELYNNLIETFGKSNLPPWADKMRDRDK